jgi:hypothetical protein
MLLLLAFPDLFFHVSLLLFDLGGFGPPNLLLLAFLLRLFLPLPFFGLFPLLIEPPLPLLLFARLPFRLKLRSHFVLLKLDHRLDPLPQLPIALLPLLLELLLSLQSLPLQERDLSRDFFQLLLVQRRETLKLFDGGLVIGLVPVQTRLLLLFASCTLGIRVSAIRESLYDIRAYYGIPSSALLPFLVRVTVPRP